jgi:hypothetical protein
MLFLPDLMALTSLFVICVQTIELDYRYTKEVDHDQQQWQKIDEMAIQAMNYWLQIPEERRDFDQAKATFMLHNP